MWDFILEIVKGLAAIVGVAKPKPGPDVPHVAVPEKRLPGPPPLPRV